MADSLFTHSSANVLAIGVGSFGARVAKAGAENAGEPPGVLWSAAHTHAAELIATGLEHKLLLNAPEGPLALQSAAAQLQESTCPLASLAVGRSAAILIASLGENSAVLLLPVLAKFLREKGLFVCALASEPFSFECGPQSEHAAALEESAEAADLFIVLHRRLLSAGLPETSALSALMAAAERKALASTEALAGAFSNQGFRPEALWPFRRYGRLAVGLGIANGKHAPLAATEAALEMLGDADLDRIENDPSSAHAMTGRAGASLAATLATSRDLSVAEAQAVSDRLRAANPSILLAFSTQSHLRDAATCLLLSHQSTSENVINIAEGLSLAK